jgi:hypothetical protein
MRDWIRTLPFIVTLAAPSVAASTPAGEAAPCAACADCTSAASVSRVVHVRMFNQTRLNAAMAETILDIANRIWAPYGVSIEQSRDADAITLVVSAGTMRRDSGDPSIAVGDTLFTKGHATPYMHLWLGAAIQLAENSEADGRPFSSRPETDQHAILVRILGVALAHELGHFLLDTARHSSEGLLRSMLPVRDLQFLDPSHLRLTRQQQLAMCQVPAGAVPQ